MARKYTFKSLSLLAFAAAFVSGAVLVLNWRSYQTPDALAAIGFLIAILAAYFFNRLGR